MGSDGSLKTSPQGKRGEVTRFRTEEVLEDLVIVRLDGKRMPQGPKPGDVRPRGKELGQPGREKPGLAQGDPKPP